MANYLITGGAGFMGSNFIRYLMDKDVEAKIVNVDKLTYAGKLHNLRDVSHKANYTFIQEDICNSRDIDKIFNYYKPEYIINFAAESHVDRSIESSEEFIKTNVLGTQVLLNTSLKYGVKKYIQISTDEVYGSVDKGYFSEESLLKPNNPYAASKAAGDLLVQSFYKTHKLPISITRSSNNYGPGQFYEKLIPMIIKNSLERKPIPIYGDGLNVRDWIYVMDHCRAVYRVLEKGKEGEIYNISDNQEKRNIDIVKLVIRKVKEILDHNNIEARGIDQGLIKYVEDRKGHDKRYGIDSNKLKSSLAWKSNYEFDYALTKTIEWYIDNRELCFNLGN